MDNLILTPRDAGRYGFAPKSPRQHNSLGQIALKLQRLVALSGFWCKAGRYLTATDVANLKLGVTDGVTDADPFVCTEIASRSLMTFELLAESERR